MIDDGTLLRRYATENAEDAFAEIVQRHLPLVYSAALRRLGGDAHRAQDVAQLVFCAVARDARRLSSRPVLAGWLYTATRNAAIDVIRSEKRRRVREQEAQVMEEIASDTEPPTDWTRLRPVLDSAMDQLSNTDREAILLRYFQSRAFADIGRTLGLNEDTARKRVDRAVERLEDLLRRRGIGSTAAALGSLLAAETVSAAPAALASTITGAAIAAGAAPAVMTAGLFAVTKLQAGIVAAALVGGVSALVIQQRAISDLQNQVAAIGRNGTTLQSQNATLAKTRAANAVEIARLRYQIANSSAAGGDAGAHGNVATFPAVHGAIAPTHGSVAGQGAPELTFPHVIPVTLSAASAPFRSGDGLLITSVRGDRPHLEPGGTYLVEGNYTLGSAPSAVLALSLTARVPQGATDWPKTQHDTIERGSGVFAFIATMQVEGRFHVSFYFPTPGHPNSVSSGAGVYLLER
jgi:RNA polymerase sigma factor (sigma-70 family)